MRMVRPNVGPDGNNGGVMSEVTYTVSGRSFTFDAASGMLTDGNGRSIHADIAVLSEGEFSVLLNGSSVHFFLSGPPSERTATIDSRMFDVVRETLRDRLAMQLQRASGTAATAVIVKAPMPGMITKILRTEGMTVKQGEGILVIEAMKMENEIKAPKNGILKRITVSERQTAEKNDHLFTIE